MNKVKSFYVLYQYSCRGPCYVALNYAGNAPGRRMQFYWFESLLLRREGLLVEGSI